jgi:tryptophanyl-tRNA synthetase
MRVVTDSTPLEAPKDPATCNVFALYRLFATEAQREALAGKYRAGGYGYGNAKKELFELVWSHLEPFRLRREALSRDLGFVESVLARGAQRAREEAGRTLKAARRAVGLE